MNANRGKWLKAIINAQNNAIVMRYGLKPFSTRAELISVNISDQSKQFPSQG